MQKIHLAFLICILPLTEVPWQANSFAQECNWTHFRGKIEIT